MYAISRFNRLRIRVVAFSPLFPFQTHLASFSLLIFHFFLNALTFLNERDPILFIPILLNHIF